MEYNSEYRNIKYNNGEIVISIIDNSKFSIELVASINVLNWQTGCTKKIYKKKFFLLNKKEFELIREIKEASDKIILNAKNDIDFWNRFLSKQST